MFGIWSRWWQWRQHRAAATCSPRARGSQAVTAYRLSLEELETRQVLSAGDAFSSAIPIALNGDPLHASAAGQGATFYALSVTDPGRLRAAVVPDGGHTRLSLVSSAGDVLVQSDGRSPDNPNGLIDVHLLGDDAGTTYYLGVESLDGDGGYTLTADFATATPPFQPLPVGTSPWSQVTADFNRDGHLDLAAANFNSHDVSVVLGRGDGTFTPATAYTVGEGANMIVTGDFDGDGFLDLATANMLATTVSVLRGLGTGEFVSHATLAVGGSPGALGAGHFNADAHLDLAVADYASGQVFVFRGTADGTFADAPTTYAVGAGPYAVAAADFDRDGLTDLMTANYEDGSVSLLLGLSDGRFAAAATTFATGAGPYTLAVGDFNGDGRPDVATANYSSNDVSVLINRGGGMFAGEVRLAAGRGANGIVTARLNRDAHLDLAVANYGEGTVSLFTGNGDGTFTDAGVVPVGSDPTFLVAGDFNEDGALDLAATNITPGNVHVLLNRGDGTFQSGPRLAPGAGAYGMVSGDFNGDGRPDLVTTNYATSDVLVLLGRADGSYQYHGRFATGSDPESGVTGDFNGDGFLDLIVTNFSTTDVTLLLGTGDGSFDEPLHFPVGYLPMRALAGYFDGDKHLDLATADYGSNTVSVLLGRGKDATDPTQIFAPAVQVAVGTNPYSLTAGYLNDDKSLDLAVANFGSGDVTVLAGDGRGGFKPLATVVTGGGPQAVVLGQFGGDGRPDLAVADASGGAIQLLINQGGNTFVLGSRLKAGANTVDVLTGDFDGAHGADLAALNLDDGGLTVFLRRADGAFAPGTAYAVGAAPFAALVEDLNNDGALDLAAVNFSSSDVSLLLGRGDGTFEDQQRLGILTGATALVEADFDGDGWLDLATPNPYSGEVSVQLGSQGGTFRDPLTISLGGAPRALTAGDFNRDGRTDLAVADSLAERVSVLLGYGDGTFRAPVAFETGQFPTALGTGDFNGDGLLDLTVVNHGSDDLSLFLGRGDGTFHTASRLSVGSSPTSLGAADLNGDGRLDLAVGNSASADVSVLLGRGDGTFATKARLALPGGVAALVAGDFTNDGNIDLAAAHPGRREVSLLTGRGDGTFLTPRSFALGMAATSLAAADFDGDGRLDLAAVSSAATAGDCAQLVVALGDGAGGFTPRAPFAMGTSPQALVATDFNRDGLADLASANGLGLMLSVVLGKGDGTFGAADVVSRSLRFTPTVADFNGDGLHDVAVLRRDGVVLVRMGRGGGGLFGSPMILNPEPGFAARDFTVLPAGGEFYITTLEAHGDTLTTYKPTGDGFFRMVSFPVGGALPSRIVAGDLNGDGLEDVAVLAVGSSEVLIGLQQPDATGLLLRRVPVGPSPSDLALMDVDGRNGLDIVVLDQFSGDVRVFFNDPENPFSAGGVYRSGTGLATVRDWNGKPSLYSRDIPTAMASGQADDLADLDLIVVNSGSNTANVLLDNGLGGLLNPEPRLSFLTGLRPIAAVTGLFNDDDDEMDFAVLNAGSGDLSVFLSDGRGGYVERLTPAADGSLQRPAAGNVPGGLTAHDVNGDGRLDLLVGNEYGDVLTLLGNGDGTFQSYRRIDQHVTLAMIEIEGRAGFVFADAAGDRVTVQYGQAGPSFEQGRQDGVLDPTRVEVADLNGDGVKDLIVANGGGNNVLVYLGLDGGQFEAARVFFSGTDPAGLTVGDLNADGAADLVVTNRGSNDLSVLFGEGQGTAWTLGPGPRLRAGSGPVSTVMRDVRGDGLPDLLVVNSESNDVYLLPGLGRGFFDDRNPVVFQTGLRPTQLFVGNFGSHTSLDLITVNQGSGDLTYFPGLGAGRTIGAGSSDPVAAVASDFDADGWSDLIVAGRSGSLGLLLGEANGPSLAGLTKPLGLMSISDLVLAAIHGNSVELYATSEGMELAIPLTFFLDLAPSQLAGQDGADSPLLAAAPDALGQPATEYSSSSPFQLNVLATLILGGGDETAAGETAALSEGAEATAAEATAADAESTPADSEAPSGGDAEGEESEEVEKGDEAEAAEAADPAVERNALITGAEETPVLDHLKEPEKLKSDAASVPFPSTPDLLDNGKAPGVATAEAADGQVAPAVPAGPAPLVTPVADPFEMPATPVPAPRVGLVGWGVSAVRGFAVFFLAALLGQHRPAPSWRNRAKTPTGARS